MAATSNKGEDEFPWWDEDPAQWISTTGVSPENVIVRYLPIETIQTQRRQSTTPTEFVNTMFANNINATINQTESQLGVWQNVHIRAEHYTWANANGGIPKHRRYHVTFRRTGFLTSIANWLVGRSGNTCMRTTWNEVSMGKQFQILVTPESPWNTHINPIGIKGIIHEEVSEITSQTFLCLDVTIVTTRSMQPSLWSGVMHQVLELEMVHHFILPYLHCMFTYATDATRACKVI